MKTTQKDLLKKKDKLNIVWINTDI